MSRLRIGELLIQQGLLTQEKLEQALAHQRAQGAEARRLGQVLVDLGFVNEVHLTRVLSQHLSVPWVSLHHIDFSRQLLNLVPKPIAEEFCVVPVYVRNERKVGDTLYLAMEDPTHDDAIRAVTAASGLPVKAMIAAASDIRGAIRVYYGGSPSEPAPPPEPDIAASPPARAAPPPPPPPRRPPPAPPSTPASAAAPAPVEPTRPLAPAPEPAPPPKPAEPAPVAPAAPPAPSPIAEAPPGPAMARVRKVTRPKPAEESSSAKRAPRMIALTLLDGTTIQIPSQRKRSTEPEPAASAHEAQLTTRDLIAALRAVANGANRDETLGDANWEDVVAALLAVLLKKQLVADWEFVEEWQKR